MLTLSADGAESLWDEILPEEVRVLPNDLARLDDLLMDPVLLAPIAARWERLTAEAGSVPGRGRPTIPMDTYVRLMILKHRCGYGYETLMREVSDSLHLRRFCRLGLSERVPEASTVRKLTRRLGAEVVHELTRELIQKAHREKRFRPRAARIDSTVLEADVRYPTDSGLAADGVRALAREGRKLAVKVREKRTAVRDRSRAMGRKLRALTRTIRRRSCEAKAEVLALTEQTGELLARSIKEARKLAQTARRRARGRGARAKLKAAKALEELVDRCEKVASQIKQRINGEPIKNRLISLWGSRRTPDPQASWAGRRDSATSISSARSRRTRRRARAVRPPTLDRNRKPLGEHAAPRHHRRTDAARDHVERDHHRRWVHADADQHRARGPGRDRAHHRPPGARLPTDPPAPTALPNRRRRPDQPARLPTGPSALKGDAGHQIWAGWTALTYNADTYATLR